MGPPTLSRPSRFPSADKEPRQSFSNPPAKSTSTMSPICTRSASGNAARFGDGVGDGDSSGVCVAMIEAVADGEGSGVWAGSDVGIGDGEASGVSVTLGDGDGEDG